MTQKVSQRFISDYAASVSLFLVFLQRWGCELLPVGKVKRAEISFFHAEPIAAMQPVSVIWDWPHEICMLIHMLSLFFP